MIYRLPFRIDGQRWTLLGERRFRTILVSTRGWTRPPSTSSCVEAMSISTEFLNPHGQWPLPPVAARGILRLGLRDFAVNQLQGLRVLGAADPARTIWTLGTFGVFFFGQMQGAYAPEIEHFLNLFGRAFWRTAGEVHESEHGAVRGLRGL